MFVLRRWSSHGVTLDARYTSYMISSMTAKQNHYYHVTLAKSTWIPLLREHQKRDELLDLSIDAGDSAAARGAHEVVYVPSVISSISHSLV